MPVRLGISHAAFAAASPVLRMAVGTAVTLSASAGDVNCAAERIAATITYAGERTGPATSRSQKPTARKPRSPASRTSDEERLRPPAPRNWVDVPWRSHEAASPGDLLRIIPGAIRWRGGAFDDGSVELVRVPELQLVRRTFHGEYCFTGDRLTRYRLELEDAKDFFTELGVYNKLAGLMRGQYGAPEKDTGVNPGATSNAYNAHMLWNTGDAQIMLGILGVGTFLTVFISFEKRD